VQPAKSPFVLPLLVLVAAQLASSGLLVVLSSWLASVPTGGLAVVGHLAGAQGFASFLEWKRPGSVAGRKAPFALAATAVHVFLGILYFLLVPTGLEGMVVSDPKKRLLLAILVVTVSALLSFGATWLGLRQGAKLAEKARKP
jgi:hypothetical protein